jgi:phosphoserine phosphatase RsbU/P
MQPIASPRVLLWVDPPAESELRRLLEDAHVEIVAHPLGDEPLPVADLILLDGTRGSEARRLCRRLRQRLGDDFVPILFVSDDPTPAARVASFEAGADAYLLRPFAPGELLAQSRAFLRVRELHKRLTERTADLNRINRRLQQAHEQMNVELELARRIQMSFLPQSLPEVPGARFAVHYALRGPVGGDCYDVFRLDENHVGLYVADAVGHGVPAALLTIFIKKGVWTKEVVGNDYRLIPPGEVLTRLNRDFVGHALPDHPFLTMVYVLFDHNAGTLSFARAGHPHPLHVPREGEPHFWQEEGSLLGVFDTTFPTQHQRVQAGDKVLLYSDGIDGGTFEGHAPGAESLLACAKKHRDLPIDEFVKALARDLYGEGSKPDDLTLLGIEVVGPKNQ